MDDLILLLTLAVAGYTAYANWDALASLIAAAPSAADGTAGGDGGDETAASDAGATVGTLLGLEGPGTPAAGTLDAATIYQMAQATLAQMNINDIDPAMVATIAMIESGGDPVAFRNEPRINDASYGLMQTLLGTATWLATVKGFTAYGTPTAATLANPQTSLYFGCAYLHYLRNYGGTVRSDAWVVSVYNGGPGGVAGTGPQTYLAKYNQVSQQLGLA